MKRRICLAALIFFLTLPIWGQEPSPGEAYHINMLILRMMDDYNRTASLSDRNTIEEFIYLFEDPDSPCIINDIPGLPGFQQKVSPREYAGIMDFSAGNLLKTEIGDLSKESGFSRKEDGKWHRTLSFRKYVMLIDASAYKGSAGGVIFDTAELLGSRKGDFLLSIDMVYDKSEDRVLISSIDRKDGVREYSPVNGDHFFVVLKPDELSEKLVYDNKPVSFNSYGQAFLPTNEIAIADDNYSIRLGEEASAKNYSVISISPVKHLLRLKSRFSISVGRNAFRTITDKSENLGLKPRSMTMEAGFDAGIMFSANTLRSGIYTGVSWSRSTLSLENSEPYTFSYNGLGYNYTILSAKEAYAFTDLMVPLYFELEYSVAPRVNLSLDLGAKLYINMDNQVLTPYTVIGTGGHGNGHDISLNSAEVGLLDPGTYGKESLDLSFFGDIEADVKAFRNIYGFVSVGFEAGLPFLLPAYAPEYKPYFNPELNVYPIYPAGGKDNLFRSYSQSFTLNRQCLRLSLGLKMKL